MRSVFHPAASGTLGENFLRYLFSLFRAEMTNRARDNFATTQTTNLKTQQTDPPLGKRFSDNAFSMNILWHYERLFGMKINCVIKLQSCLTVNILIRFGFGCSILDYFEVNSLLFAQKEYQLIITRNVVTIIVNLFFYREKADTKFIHIGTLLCSVFFLFFVLLFLYQHYICVSSIDIELSAVRM